MMPRRRVWCLCMRRTALWGFMLLIKQISRIILQQDVNVTKHRKAKTSNWDHIFRVCSFFFYNSTSKSESLQVRMDVVNHLSSAKKNRFADGARSIPLALIFGQTPPKLKRPCTIRSTCAKMSLGILILPSPTHPPSLYGYAIRADIPNRPNSPGPRGANFWGGKF